MNDVYFQAKINLLIKPFKKVETVGVFLIPISIQQAEKSTNHNHIAKYPNIYIYIFICMHVTEPDNIFKVL